MCSTKRSAAQSLCAYPWEDPKCSSLLGHGLQIHQSSIPKAHTLAHNLTLEMPPKCFSGTTVSLWDHWRALKVSAAATAHKLLLSYIACVLLLQPNIQLTKGCSEKVRYTLSESNYMWMLRLAGRFIFFPHPETPFPDCLMLFCCCAISGSHRAAFFTLLCDPPLDTYTKKAKNILLDV